MADCLPKHEKYEKAYKSNELYWGLGIENESYIEFAASAKTTAEFIRSNQKRERYSVDYWKLYKPGIVQKNIEQWIDSLPQKEKTPVSLPVLANGHTLAKTDRFGEPKTTYSEKPLPNPKFSGKTLLDDLAALEPDVFVKGKDIWWTFDGDTIEFITQGFYNAKMEDVVLELIEHKRVWLEAFKKGLASLTDREDGLQGVPKYPLKNYGFAVFLTNRQNVAIFNNGTYHINITIPSRLNSEKKIADMDLFKVQHCMAARLFQWFSPFLVAKFGSPDIFANLTGGGAFPTGSQRLCASRYVSVGTYNTETMTPGKVLLLPNKSDQKRWYDIIYSKVNCPYETLQNIGVDINYNKHWNHGLEFRIFDWFPEEMIPYLFRALIWMCDESLHMGTVPNPLGNSLWNSFLARCVWDGSDARMTAEEEAEFEKIFGKGVFKLGTSALQGYDAIWLAWFYRWNDSTGTCTELMIRDKLIIPGVLHSSHNTLKLKKEKILVDASVQTETKDVVPAKSWSFKICK